MDRNTRHRADSDPGREPGGLPAAYRRGVGAVILNREGRIFAGQRRDAMFDAWQMPQGGIDEGEAPLEAVLREVREETGIDPRKLELLGETREWIRYDVPPELVPNLWGGRYRGQEQRWFAFRFLGSDEDIDIETEHPEFRAWRWMDPDELLANIVPFKRDLYAHVLAEFAPLLEEHGKRKHG